MIFVNLKSWSPVSVFFKKEIPGTSLVVQWLRIHLPMQEEWVQSLVRELRYHMPCDQKKKKIKQKQYCNKFNEDFKNSPHQKKNFFKEFQSLVKYFWKAVKRTYFISATFPVYSCHPSLSPLHYRPFLESAIPRTTPTQGNYPQPKRMLFPLSQFSSPPSPIPSSLDKPNLF